MLICELLSPTAIMEPLPLKARHEIGPLEKRINLLSFREVFHNFTTLSPPPVAILLPYGRNARHWPLCSCAFIRCITKLGGTLWSTTIGTKLVPEPPSSAILLTWAIDGPTLVSSWDYESESESPARSWDFYSSNSNCCCSKRFFSTSRLFYWFFMSLCMTEIWSIVSAYCVLMLMSYSKKRSRSFFVVINS